MTPGYTRERHIHLGLEALQKSPVFKSMSARALTTLVDSAKVEKFEAGDVIMERGHEGSWFALLEGQVSLDRVDDDPAAADREQESPHLTSNTFMVKGRDHIHLNAVALMGEFNALDGLPFEARVVALTKGVVLRLEAGALQELLSYRRSLRRQVIAGLNEAPNRAYITGGSTAMALQAMDQTQSAEVLRFEAHDEAKATLEVMMALTARALHLDFGERVVCASIGGERLEQLPSLPGTPRFRVPLKEFKAWRLKTSGQVDFILTQGPDEAYEDLMVTTRVRVRALSAPQAAASASHGALSDFDLVVVPKDPPLADGLGGVERVWRMLGKERSSGGIDLTKATTPLVANHGCRIRLDLSALGSVWSSTRDLDGYGAEARAAFGRLTRALTHRRVGVALGGSGAWGFANVALLQMLREGDDPVPVDMISGVSSGSLIGAYYCGLGDEGLDRLIKHGDSGYLDLMVATSAVNSRFIQLVVDLDLRGRWLESLDTDFFPLCTDLTQGRSMTWARGPVGLAVRAASSAPGLFTPTFVDRRRLVDGCFVNNVPASVVAEHADMVVACNAYPFNTRSGGTGLFKGAVGSFVQGLNPLIRAMDLGSSANLMLHTSGEWQSVNRSLSWDASERNMPLIGSMRFDKASDFVKQMRDSQEGQDFVALVRRHWDKMRGPHQGRSPS